MTLLALLIGGVILAGLVRGLARSLREARWIRETWEQHHRRIVDSWRMRGGC